MNTVQILQSNSTYKTTKKQTNKQTQTKKTKIPKDFIKST